MEESLLTRDTFKIDNQIIQTYPPKRQIDQLFSSGEKHKPGLVLAALLGQEDLWQKQLQTSVNTGYENMIHI